jgi:polyphosphate kinase
VRSLIGRQHACATLCLQDLAAHGVRVLRYAELADSQRDFLNAWFRSTVFPYLTPRAITFTPGHSLPVVAGNALCFSVALREIGVQKALHLAELTVPPELPRFVPVPESTDYIAIEDIIRPNVSLLYPGRRVEQAHLFRVTRYSDVEVDEQRSGNLVQAMQERTQQRRHQPIVRIEVEPSMPQTMRELLIRELQLEPGARPDSLQASDVFEAPGMMDLEALHALANLPLPDLAFPPFSPRLPLAPDTPLWDTIRERDLLFHHPYDDFAATVVRFFNEAADDGDVAAIKVALYRAGERSPIIDALARAAKSGKHVTVFVELKARFDEARNVRWTRQLEAAGAHVVHGLPGYKNHSKIAMVVRREADGPRRYAHIGTGNYNAATARVYTDLGVLTSRPTICDDVSDLFNTLTGSSAPSDVAYRACLVAPNALLQPLLQRIEREADHARSGRGGRIRIKINGLSDREVINALYRASQAGVTIELMVRGVCTLAPGVPGISDRIRVASIVGRFLEHARIYEFANAGDPEFFIGSADLRPRNLRRRIEVLVPIASPNDRARLADILDRELQEPVAWTLRSDGTYVRETGRGDNRVGSQAHFTAEALLSPALESPTS